MILYHSDQDTMSLSKLSELFYCLPICLIETILLFEILQKLHIAGAEVIDFLA